MLAEKELIVKESLQLNGINSMEDLALKHSILVILSKIEEAKNSIQYFTNKHKQNFSDFSDSILSNSNEDFDKSDDRNEWQFMEESLITYNRKLSILKND